MLRTRSIPVLVAGAALGLLACSNDGSPMGGHSDGSVTPPAPFDVNCTVAEPGPEAKLPAGPQPDGSTILLGGRKLTPAGRVLPVGGFPLALRVLPGDRYVVVTDGAYGDEALRIVDLQAADPQHAVVTEVPYPMTSGSPASPGLFYGLALSSDGKRLYVSMGGHDPLPDSTPLVQHYNIVQVFDLAPPALTRNEAAELHLLFNKKQFTDGSALSRIPAGLTLSADDKTLYVACQGDDTMAIVDVAAGSATYGTELGRASMPGMGATPFDVALDEAGHTAYVSLWGGGGVVPVDVADRTRPLAALTTLLTGQASEAALLGGGAVWVANSGSDTVTRIDPATHALVQLPVSADGAAHMGPSLLGSTPNNLFLDGKKGRLYVADAGDNSLTVFDTKTNAPVGALPTAWYPTAVATLSDGTVLIASGKGLGLGPTSHQPSTYTRGVLQVVPPPSDADLVAGAQQVADNRTRPARYQAAVTCPATGDKRFAGRADLSSKTPIEHVFLVVRENKTYDAVLGDLAGSNGSPSLTMFGADVTPNLHALAHAFTNLDNFYDNSEQSLQGHEWTTAATTNDYVEKAWENTWGRYWRPLAAFGAGPLQKLTVPGGDTLWSHFDKAKLAYHNYGEVANTATAGTKVDNNYPGVFFSLGIPDVKKIAYVIQELDDPNNPVEPFVYLSLPDDHTYGTAPGKPTPQSMVADNDEATGRFIDALSHSKLWASSIVFIVEDDPSDGADHVDGHRSPCVVISPWVKRGYVSSVNHDFPALAATFLRLLGTPPMYQTDADAALFTEVFADKPDLTPYTFLPRKVPEGNNAVDAPMAEESARIDWTHADSAPLGRILWKAVKGRDAEPPWGAVSSPIPRGQRDNDGDDD